LADVDIVIASHGFVARLPWVTATAWRLLVVDEAQAIKHRHIAAVPDLPTVKELGHAAEAVTAGRMLALKARTTGQDGQAWTGAGWWSHNRTGQYRHPTSDLPWADLSRQRLEDTVIRSLVLAVITAALLAPRASVVTPVLAQEPAQTFPRKTITIVIPASPGGAIDLVARLVGDKLTQAWGQPVVIDNKPGATGIIGTDLVARAAPDGHTLALVASSHAINPSTTKKLPFDPLKSFEPVVLTHIVPLVLVVALTLPATNLKELIAYAKANPGKLSFASSGVGGAPHMSGELFVSMAGLDMTHVPYKGSTLAHPDLRGGITSIMFDTVAAIQPLLKGGTVRALAVTTAKRSSVPPDLPTMAEAGLPGYETSTWGGVLAPARTPQPVVAKLNAEINKALAAPDVQAKLSTAGIETAGGTPQEFEAFIQSEMKKWADVAQAAKITPE
jgi:tripartite-type tricarboxylate transporter receptor subunit TctC